MKLKVSIAFFLFGSHLFWFMRNLMLAVTAGSRLIKSRAVLR